MGSNAILRWTLLTTIVCNLMSASGALSRDVRACVSIPDINRRIECLEGREDATTTPEPPPLPLNTQTNSQCGRAPTPIEAAVCADPNLVRLESQIEQLNSQAAKIPKNNSVAIATHRDWMILRNGRCSVGTPANMRLCLHDVMSARIKDLQAYVNTPPQQPPDNKTVTAEPLPPLPSVRDAPSPSPRESSPPAVRDTPAVTRESAPQPVEAKPSVQIRTDVEEANAGKLMMESLQSLLSNPRTENLKFFRYVVDQKDLEGFSSDMPILRVVYDERVFFDTDKAALRAEAIPVVRSIAASLKRQTGKVALFVAGHTDARGPEQYNLDLSVKRAEGVANAIRQQGVGQAHIWRVGFGKAIPIRPNTTEQNMAYNRRVEFLVATQASVITAWIKKTKGLCEDESCGTTSVISNFQATPITDNGAKAISIEIPAPKPVEIEMNPQPVEVEAPFQ